ncbi:MAG: phosphatidylglycerophosphatase A family protein [Candidatus Binatia bacterium]
MSSLRRKLTLALATGAGVGYSPFFPGTMGTLFAMPFSLALNRLAETAPTFALILLVGLTFGAIKISTAAAEIMHVKDPQIIIADEIVGFMIANFLAPLRWAPLLLGFLLFRIFDIAKVYPAARLEKLPGGIGIVLDDVAAGVYAFVIVQTFLYWRWL